VFLNILGVILTYRNPTSYAAIPIVAIRYAIRASGSRCGKTKFASSSRSAASTDEEIVDPRRHTHQSGRAERARGENPQTVTDQQ
jgi:hypothetical protein